MKARKEAAGKNKNLLSAPDRIFPGRKIALSIIFSTGFMALTAQTLLFRDFLTIYEGNELGTGFFFFSWLLWVGLGALAGYKFVSFARRLLNNFELQPLLYLPAFLIQQVIITNSRWLAGIKSFELFAFFKMFPVSLLTCAPVSLVTGYLFTAGCSWLLLFREGRTAVTTVYMAESLGSFSAGILVTLLLAAGTEPETIFLLAALVIAVSVCVIRCFGRKYISGILPLLFILILLASGAGTAWHRHKALEKWQTLAGENPCAGYFTTPQASYLYGHYNSQLVIMAWGSVCESYPDRNYGGETALLHLAQHPGASRILILGQGSLPVCRAFLDLPQVQQVTWLSQDAGYSSKLMTLLPGNEAKALEKLEIPAENIHTFLETSETRYDLAILHFPAASTQVLNSFFTENFYRKIKRHLTTDGIIGVQIPGGENWLGTELIHLGTSAFTTLQSVFRHITIKPGEQSWLLAGDRGDLSAAPGILAGRLAAIQGLAAVYPAAEIGRLYNEERANSQLDLYRRTAAGNTGGFFLNTENWPKAMLYSLLLSVKQVLNAESLLPFVKILNRAGILIFSAWILLIILLRVHYRLKGKPQKKEDSPVPPGKGDSFYLIFSAGAAALSTYIVIMYKYQSAYGSLFLHNGLLSALFMAGLFCGSTGCSLLLSRLRREPFLLLPVLVFLYILLLLALMLVPGSRLFCVLLIFCCGLLSGCFIPPAVYRLHQASLATQAAGSALELYDHLGGAAGALLTGIVFLPVLGITATLLILVIIQALNLLPHLLSSLVSGKDRAGPARPLLYLLSGVVLGLLATSVITHYCTGTTEKDIPADLAAEWASGSAPEAVQVLLNNTPFTYYAVTQPETGRQQYIFNTQPLAPGISGYGGPIDLALCIDEDGILLRLKVLASHETPAYLSRLDSWLKNSQKGITGRNLFAADSFGGADTVTGATITSRAVMNILDTAGKFFGSRVLKKFTGAQAGQSGSWITPVQLLWLPVMITAALILRQRPGRWSRRIYLITLVLTAGILLNYQYSSVQVFSLPLLGDIPLSLNPFLLLTAGIPLLVLFAGNLYCGYLCPFGALQELTGDLLPQHLSPTADKKTLQVSAHARYLLLMFLIVLFSLGFSTGVFAPDPLVYVFGRQWQLTGIAVLCVTFIPALFYKRFWCWNFCPAGALLALLSRIRIIRRLSQPVIPAKCDIGVRNAADRKCLCCDRCRIPHNIPPAGAARQPGRNRIFLGITAVVFIVLVFFSVSFFITDKGVILKSGRGTVAAVDMPKLESLIKAGKLSNHEALYYESATEE